MRRTARLTAAAVAVGLVFALSAPLSAFAAPPPDFEPSSSKWRQYMLTVTSKVLGAAMPSKWQAEMIANEYALRYSPDALAKATGIGAGNPLDRTPETIEDYYAQEYERQHKRGIVAKNRNGAVPATAAKGLIKTVAGVGTVFTGLEVGTFLGAKTVDGIAGMGKAFGWYSFDPNGLVCRAAADQGDAGFLTSWVTGQDCSAFDLADTYIPNSDTEGQTTFAYGGVTSIYLGSVTPAGWSYRIQCLGGPFPVGPAGSSLEKKNLATGAWVNVGNPSTGGDLPRCLSNGGISGATRWTASELGTTGPVMFRFKSSTGAVIAESVTVKGDPTRHMDCTTTYTDNTTLTTVGPAYKESEGKVKPAVCAETPSGKVPKNIKINEVGGGTTPHKVYDENTTPEFQEYAANYPECAEQLCLLDLVKKTPGSVVSCFDLTGGCPGWFEDPAKADTYQCVYAAEAVPLEECNAYAGLFTPQRIEIGSPYNDPSTGTWSGGQSAPKSGQTAMAHAVQNPAQLRSCDFSGLGFDPVGWVLRPIQCAFEWAAIPRPTVVELHNAQLDAKWKLSMPGKYATAVSGVGTAFSSLGAGNCSGIGVNVPVPDSAGHPTSMSGNVLNSCPGSPLAPAAGVSFWILSGVVLLGGVWGLRRMLDRFVGF